MSGGADSSVLLYMAANEGYDEIHTLTFDYNQRHKREIDCVAKQLDNIRKQFPDKLFTNKILDVSYISQLAPSSSLTNKAIANPDINKIAGDAQPVSYVPFRNMMFLSICCANAESVGAPSVLYGSAQVDSLAGYWDGSTEYIDNFNNLIALNRVSKIEIKAPLLKMSKAQIVREGVKLGVNFADTWTCYSDRADGLADATTPSSSLRIRGFLEAGFKDPIKYMQQDRVDKLYITYKCKDIL